jgi:hypothetical protein
MSKSRIYVTIPANSATKPRPEPATPAQIGPIAAAFFLIFDCATVEPSLTNKESNTYKRLAHSITQTVHL